MSRNFNVWMLGNPIEINWNSLNINQLLKIIIQMMTFQGLFKRVIYSCFAVFINSIFQILSICVLFFLIFVFCIFLNIQSWLILLAFVFLVLFGLLHFDLICFCFFVLFLFFSEFPKVVQLISNINNFTMLLSYICW